MATLMHRKPTSAGTSHDNSHAQENKNYKLNYLVVAI
jgi:hypothetical protein